jgi:O-antigen ligase
MTRQIQSILKYIVMTGIFIVPFIPLVVANSFFFPFITGKGFTFRIVVEIMFAAWVILAVISQAYRPQRSWIVWSLLGFLAIIGLADALGVNPGKSFWSNFERMEGYITFLHLGAYFFIVSTVLKTQRLWNWFWSTTLVASLIMVLYGLLQLSGAITINQGGVRLDGTFGNATYLAVYMLFSIFITTYLMVSGRYFLFIPQVNTRKAKLIVGLPVITLFFFILYKTATRGAILGLIAGILVAAVFIVLFERRRPRLRKAALSMVIATVVIVVGFIALKDTQFVRSSPVLSRFSSISLNDRTTLSRFILADMAVQGVKERPVLGWGQENFNYIFNKYYDPKLYGQEQWFDRTHNVITDWLVAGGILGLLAYLSLYASVLWYIWKGSIQSSHFSVPEKSLLTGLLIAYFIHNLFVFDNLISYIMFFSVAAYVHFRATEEALEAAEHHRYVENRFIAPVAIVALLMVIYTVNIRPIQANTTLIKAIQVQAAAPANGIPGQQIPFNGDVTRNLELFQEVVAKNTFGTPEALEQLLTIAQTVATAQVPITQREELVNYAIEQMMGHIEAHQDDARYYVLYGAFLNQIGKYQDAITYLTKATELSPGKQTIHFELASTYAHSDSTIRQKR